MAGSSSHSAEKLHGLVPESFETYQIVNPGDIVLRTTDLQNDHTSLRVGMVRDRGIITLGLSGSASEGRESVRISVGSPQCLGHQQGHLRLRLRPSPEPGLLALQANACARFPALRSKRRSCGFWTWANGRLERAIRAKRKVITLLREQKRGHRPPRRHPRPRPQGRNLPTGDRWFLIFPSDWRPLTLERLINSPSTVHTFRPRIAIVACLSCRPET